MISFDRFGEIIQKASIMKQNMEKKQLIRAKAKCPYCDGHWHMLLTGPKKHPHMHCDGDCGAMMMS